MKFTGFKQPYKCNCRKNVKGFTCHKCKLIKMSLLMHPKYKSDCNGNLYRNQQIQVNENACTGGASDHIVFRYGGSTQIKRQGEICVWI